MKSVKQVHHNEEEEQVLIASSGNHHTVQEDAQFVTQLKACAIQRDLYKGSKLHANVLKGGLLEKNIFIGSALVNMYAKCGALAKAQHVVNELSVHNVVSWNALIVGHAQQGHDEQAFDCFERMQHEGLSPDATTFACILKVCASIRIGEKGKEVHAEIARRSLLGNDIVLGNALVDMYAKCGALAIAHQVFGELLVQNVVTWTAIIAGYCLHGHGEKALNCFNRMQSESISPDRVTLLCILQVCGSVRAAEKGKEIHAVIVTDELLRKDIVLGNALVDMYAKCGALLKAQKAFDELPFRNVVSWTALVVGYCQHGYGEEALYWFGRMQCEGLSPDAVTFSCILKACGSIGAVEKGKQIHDEILREGLLGKDSVLPTALVDMYAKCGELGKAQQVFDELQVQNVLSWNALITGYSQHGYGEEALDCYERMQCEGFSPNEVTFVCALKACGSTGQAEKGKEIHVDIARGGLLGKRVLGSALVDMYIKCSALAKAQEVFDRLDVQDVVSWTALIAGYCQHGHFEKALSCFEQMKDEGLSPDAVAFACILRACGSLGAAEQGEMYFETMSAQYGIIPTLEDCTCMVDLFAYAGHFDKAITVIKKMPSSDYLPVWFALLSACRKWGNVKLGKLALEHVVRLVDDKCAVAYATMSNIYVAAGMLEDAGKTLAKAQRVFDDSQVRDVVSWNALITGYYEQRRYMEAFDCFERMKQEGFSPDAVTFICVLKACGSIGAFERGEEIHDNIVKVGLLGKDSVLGTTLVDMYAKCGALAKAKQFFDELPCQDVVSWNALIAGYCQHGHGEEAINYFEQMKYEGLSHDAMTFSCILKACGSIGAANKGEEIHAEIFRKGLLGKDIVLGNALVDMYSKCGALAKAQQVFDELPIQNTVAWNALIAGYFQDEDAAKALNCFERMNREGPAPDAVTFVCILKACGSIGAVEKGKEIHVEIAREGLLGKVSVLGSALVDMYAKCGALAKAQEVFDKLPVQDIVSWTALIAGYCQYGFGEESLTRFERMKRDGLLPDAVTFTCVLKACSSIGAVERGQMYIESMSETYGIVPVLEHHTSMVHLFGCAGHFDMAMAIIKKMPLAYYLPAWFALLSACLQWGNVKLGKLVFEHAVQGDKSSAVAYVCMSNIYAAASMQEDAIHLKATRMDCEAWKGPGHFWTDASHFVFG